MRIRIEQLELDLKMDEEKTIKNEKAAGMPVTGILKRKSRKPAIAAKKKAAAESSTAKQPLAADSDHFRNGQAKFTDVAGIRTIYYMAGNVRSRGPFDGIHMQGEWQFFKNNGRLSEIGHFKDDVKDGKWLRFTDSGIIENSQNYKDGEIIKG